MADTPSTHAALPAASGEGDTGPTGILTRALTQLTEQTTATSKAVQKLADLIASTYQTQVKEADGNGDAA